MVTLALIESPHRIASHRIPFPTHRIPDARPVPQPTEEIQPHVKVFHVERGQEVLEGQQREEHVRPRQEVNGGAHIEYGQQGARRVQGDQEQGMGERLVHADRDVQDEEIVLVAAETKERRFESAGAYNEEQRFRQAKRPSRKLPQIEEAHDDGRE